MSTREERQREANKKWRDANKEYLQEKRRLYYAANKDAIKERNRQHQIANKDRHFERHLLRTYGITLNDRDALLVKQEGVCAICHQDGQGKALCIDHDHTTGRVRALLCHHCNTGLGHFFDDLSRLASAIRYLSEHADPVNPLTVDAGNESPHERRSQKAVSTGDPLP